MLKKIIIFSTNLILILCLATGCSNKIVDPDKDDNNFDSVSKYDPEIELTVPGVPDSQEESDYDYLNNQWVDVYKNALGINITSKWDADTSTDGVQKLNEQLAIGVVPDIMIGLSRSQFDFVVRLGLAADLTDLFDEYATPLTKEILNSDGGHALRYSTIDGKLYALPYVYGYTDNILMMWIRTDWLENLGMEYPRTSDELYMVLDAFVNKDPDQDGVNNTVGLCTSNSLYEIGSIFNMFGAQPFWSWYLNEDNVLRYSTVSYTDNIKKSLAYMQRLYKENLMYSEFGIMDSAEYYKMFADGKAGIAFEYKYFPLQVEEGEIQNNINANWQAFPIPTGLENNEPARPFSYHGPAAYGVISSKCKNPEAAIKMLNLYTEIKFSENKEQYYLQYIKDEKGYNIDGFALFSTARANDLSEFEHVAEAVEKQDPSQLKHGEKLRYDACMKYLEGNRKNWLDYKLYGPGNVSTTVLQYYRNSIIPFFSDFDGPNTTSMHLNIAMLNSKWIKTCTRIIMSGEAVNNYDDYVEDWYAFGGDKIEEEANAEYLKAASSQQGIKK